MYSYTNLEGGTPPPTPRYRPAYDDDGGWDGVWDFHIGTIIALTVFLLGAVLAFRRIYLLEQRFSTTKSVTAITDKLEGSESTCTFVRV